jgi:hypothetical protein
MLARLSSLLWVLSSPRVTGGVTDTSPISPRSLGVIRQSRRVNCRNFALCQPSQLLVLLHLVGSSPLSG